MRPSELHKVLVEVISIKQPILVVGMPGIGKTAIIEQAAKTLNMRAITSHPVISDPTDIKGLPWPDSNAETATFLPFGDTAEILNANEPILWVLDDLGQAPPATQASYMQPLLTRKINGQLIPDCVAIVAASNRRTDKAGVSSILEPVKSRFLSIVTLDPHLDDSCAWAIDNDIQAMIIAFWRWRPGLLADFKPTADMTNSPVPRTWEGTSKILKMDLPMSSKFELISGAIGEGAATEFFGFMQIVNELPDLDDVIENPKSVDIPTKEGALYALCTGLAEKANTDNIKNIGVFAQRLCSEEERGEFTAMLLRDLIQRHQHLTHTKELVDLLADDHISQLLGGDNDLGISDNADEDEKDAE